MAKHFRSRPKLQIAIVLSLSLFLFSLSVWFMFPCKHCSERFGALSARGLTQHQRKCQAFLKHEAEANQRRKTTAASYKVRRTRLKDRKARLGSAAPGFNGIFGLAALDAFIFRWSSFFYYHALAAAAAFGPRVRSAFDVIFVVPLHFERIVRCSNATA